MNYVIDNISETIQNRYKITIKKLINTLLNVPFTIYASLIPLHKLVFYLVKNLWSNGGATSYILIIVSSAIIVSAKFSWIFKENDVNTTCFLATANDFMHIYFISLIEEHKILMCYINQKTINSYHKPTKRIVIINKNLFNRIDKLQEEQ